MTPNFEIIHEKLDISPQEAERRLFSALSQLISYGDLYVEENEQKNHNQSAV